MERTLNEWMAILESNNVFNVDALNPFNHPKFTKLKKKLEVNEWGRMHFTF